MKNLKNVFNTISKPQYMMDTALFSSMGAIVGTIMVVPFAAMGAPMAGMIGFAFAGAALAYKVNSKPSQSAPEQKM